MARRFLIGGHRGVGENLFLEKATAPPSSASVIPQFRENTIHSFLRAADCGVDFVEFDVQVTRDNHAVLWHDDTVVQQRHLEQGMPVVATAVKDMTLDAFRHVVGSAAPSARLVRHFRGAASRSPLPQEVLPWDCAVEDQLPTLEEVFRAVPKRVAFDVEIKMTEGDDVERTPPEEVERVVNCIWDVVRQHGRHGPEAAPAAETAASAAAAASGRSEVPEDQASALGVPARRDLFFSSFDPDVCEAIRMKQGEYDVYFLSGCGLYQHVDSRRTSIAAALAFASDKHLSGVVLPAQVLLANPGMVEEAAAMGLKLMTYGLENDESDAISKQQRLGISGAIVDDVQSLMSRHARAVQTAAA